MNVYTLPINKNYVRHWGMPEAVREIIQNALDSNSPFEWEVRQDDIDKTKYSLFVMSFESKLEPSSLILGTTSKADSSGSIGSFGEGYKIAMLVLTRLDYKVTIFNGDHIWRPEFKMDDKYGVEVLNIVESDIVLYKNKGLTFQVGGLSEEDIEEIKQSCLHMQDSIGPVKHTSKGLILMDRPGKLYVAGLYICDTELDYGYDVRPKYIKLERDRQTVDNWDLKTLARDMWFEAASPEQVAELIEQKCPDLEHADWTSPAEVKDACYNLFYAKNENAIPVRSQEQADEIRQSGIENKPVYVGSVFHSNITGSSKYQKVSMKPAPTIHSKMEKFFEDHWANLATAETVDAFQVLLEASKEWVKK